MKVDHKYTMCKSQGFELLVEFPTTSTGRQLAQQLLSPKAIHGSRRAKQIVAKTTDGPISRVMERRRQRPSTAKASRYLQHLEQKEKAKAKPKPDTEIQAAAAAAAVPPVNNNNKKKKPSHVLILLPKNGNNKKKIKIKEKQQDLNIRTPNGDLNLGDSPPRRRAIPLAESVSVNQLVDSLKIHLEDHHIWAQVQDLKEISKVFQERRTTTRALSATEVENLAKTVTRSMTDNETMAAVQWYGCQLFFFLSLNLPQDDRTLEKKELNIVETMLSSMQIHSDNDLVQVAATQALREVLFRADWLRKNHHNLDAVEAKSMLQALHSAMTVHEKNATIQANALILLQSVARVNDEIQEEYASLFWQEGGPIHTAMLTHQSNAVVQIGGALNLNLPKLRVVFGWKCITAKGVQAVVLATVDCMTICTGQAGGRQAYISLSDHNPSAFSDGLRSVCGATEDLTNHCEEIDQFSANPQVSQRSGLFKYWTTAIKASDIYDVDAHYRYFTKSVVKAMRENAGEHGLELEGCRTLAALAEKSSLARTYILHGEAGSQQRFNGIRFGDADNALFAIVQRYGASPNEAFQAAGSLMLELRRSSVAAPLQ